MQTAQPEVKIILLGEFGVGKTSMFRRFSQGTFVDTSAMDWTQYRESTMGLDNYCRKFDCTIGGQRYRDTPDTNQQRSIKSLGIRLFDTGGLERIGSISNSYYKFSDAVLLVFSKNSMDSFNCLTQHLLEVLSLAENAKLFLVSNKHDLSETEVTDEDVHSFMEQFPKIEEHFKISCKTNRPSVEDMFAKIANRLASSGANRLANRLDTIKLTSPGNYGTYSGIDNHNSQLRNSPSYEHQYERNGDVYRPGGSCSTCMSQ